jgi:mono/diheme cytochrome c family protein
MPMESSQQLRNQLKKFAAGELRSMGTVQREIFEATRVGGPNEGGSVGASGRVVTPGGCHGCHQLNRVLAIRHTRVATPG